MLWGFRLYSLASCLSSSTGNALPTLNIRKDLIVESPIQVWSFGHHCLCYCAAQLSIVSCSCYFIAAVYIYLPAINGCTTGDIRVIGSNSACSLVGRIDLCHKSHWRAVCQSRWGKNDARVVCQQFGFPKEGQ